MPTAAAPPPLINSYKRSPIYSPINVPRIVPRIGIGMKDPKKPPRALPPTLKSVLSNFLSGFPSPSGFGSTSSKYVSIPTKRGPIMGILLFANFAAALDANLLAPSLVPRPKILV